LVQYHHKFEGEKDAIKFFNILNTNFSIVRWECINEAFGKTDTHDTETPGYKWKNQKIMYGLMLVF
jgi:hypothetical protein